MMLTKVIRDKNGKYEDWFIQERINNAACNSEANFAIAEALSAIAMLLYNKSIEKKD
jgi:hypothetical protein